MLSKIFNITRYPYYVRKLWWKTVVPWRLKKRGIQLGKEVQIIAAPIVSMIENSQIQIDDRCVLCSESEQTALGVNHPVILRTLRPGASIHIHENTGMSGTTICAATEITIGSHVLIGANVTIIDTDFHAINAKGRRYNKNYDDIATSAVHIADNVFIGAGAYILKGVNIGENSVIGAGAIVIHDIPANAIATGNPAKVTGVVN